MTRDERLNKLANCLMECWEEHLPLSLRYEAAEWADHLIEFWFEAKNGINL